MKNHKQEYRKVIEKILSGEIKTAGQLDLEKRRLAKELNLGKFIRNSEILRYAKPSEKEKLKLLVKKPIRTESGVAVVAVMTKPAPCPHGKCRYCPGGPQIDVPQSYTGKEPATRRAIQYGFDPYMQTTFRLEQLKTIGHPVDKVELIVMGGTLTAQCIDYQEWFVKRCLEAMNDFEENYDFIFNSGDTAFLEKKKEEEYKFRYLEEIQEMNETAPARCVGVTFEPRPDWATKEQIDYMLNLGVTRIEMGVQNPYDFIYRRINRGHRVKDVAEATRQLKDSGLKVAYHMMPGLLGYNPGLDLRGFKKIFEDERFRPDMLKLYPLIILKGTEYYDMWEKGEFEPITTRQAVEIIVKVKEMMPKWVRTIRIMRDIPSNLVEAGIKSSNLGEIVYKEMEKMGIKCSCIRCREVGHKLREGIEPKLDYIGLTRTEYDASGGREIFLSYEDTKQDILIGFLRLRKPHGPFRKEIVDAMLVRELHVYGPMVEIGESPRYEWQHRGYGRELLAEAERISREEFDAGKILITSGIGARDYYRKFGYRGDGVYMGKELCRSDSSC